MKFLGKIIFFLIYPFVYLLHPQLRRSHQLRIKYWLMDNSFFKEQFKIIAISFFVAIFCYGFLFHGIGILVAGTKSATYTIQQNIEKSVEEYEESKASNPETRSKFNNDIVQKNKVIEINQEEYESVTVVVDHKKVMKEKEDKLAEMLRKAREKKQN